MPAHALDVVGGDLLEVRPAVVGEDGEHHPAVEVGRPALDDAHPHEPVEAAGEAAGGELQAAGEVAHPHLVVVGLGEVHEHLVVAERQAVRGEVGLEGRVEVDDGLGVRAPGRHLVVVQPPGRVSRRHHDISLSNAHSIVAMVRIGGYTCDRKGKPNAPPPTQEGRTAMSQTSTTTALPAGTWDARRRPQPRRLHRPPPHGVEGARHVPGLQRRHRHRRRPAGLDGQRHRPDGLHRHRRRGPRRPPADQRLLRRRAVPDDDVHVHEASPAPARLRGHGRPDDQGRHPVGHVRPRGRRRCSRTRGATPRPASR